MMRDLKWHLAGVTGTSCSHSDGYGDRVVYEACDKHHVDAAYQCVKQFLNQPEIRALMKETVQDYASSEDVVTEIIKIITGATDE